MFKFLYFSLAYTSEVGAARYVTGSPPGAADASRPYLKKAMLIISDGSDRLRKLSVRRKFGKSLRQFLPS